MGALILAATLISFAGQMFPAETLAASPSPTQIGPFFDDISHIVVGVVAAAVGMLAHRTWSRRRWRRAPAATVVEAVLVVDLVNSTWLATHHGGDLAMRARNVLERRSAIAAEPHGVIFVETTGDGCMMMFASVAAAARAATQLLRDLQDQPPDMAPGPPLDVRAAICYGEILLDARGVRHGAVMNKAFRLLTVTSDACVTVVGEAKVDEFPDRNRILIDEAAADELRTAGVAFLQVGVCRLKGFNGFHRVYELCWNSADGGTRLPNKVVASGMRAVGP